MNSLPSRFRLRRPVTAAAVVTLLFVAIPLTRAAGPVLTSGFKVLPPIVHGNLAMYPVVPSRSYDTSRLLTLDEGTRSGQVTISESGMQPAMMHPGQRPVIHSGAEVDRLVLYNDSDRPLLLLAGEIVTGGKQDRVIGSDRIVPPKSGPIDLSVFCVEPGRWTGATAQFGSLRQQMAQPLVRAPAMAEKDQQAVWNSVRKSNAQVASRLQAGEAEALHGTTSYAKVFASAPVQQVVETYGGSESEQSALALLRKEGAVGVVVAVHGQILWADLFASTDLLARYWPKLSKSYIAEAMTAEAGGTPPNTSEAEAWVNAQSGVREVSETEPGVYRRTEVTGNGFQAFELDSLWAGGDFPVHRTKIRRQPVVSFLR